MVDLQHIYKSYADKHVLNDICLSVSGGEVVALIGNNGSGKSTLLNLLYGNINADSGTINLHNETIGYVQQDLSNTGTVLDLFDNRDDVWKIDYALDLVELGDISITSKISELSGGQKTRLAFASIIANDPCPTTLLLDEPTNNLDYDGLLWLEHFIENFRGAILLVSHDRNFINKVATCVIELDKGKLKKYGGNYDFFKNQKAIEYQSEFDKYKTSLQERKNLEKVLLEKQHRASKGLKNNKLRDNDKAQHKWHQNSVQRSFSSQARALQSRIDQLEVIDKPESNKPHRISMLGSIQSSKLILRSTNLSKQYDTSVIEYQDFEIRGAERLHIIGPNGSGKSTLLKIAADKLKQDNGNIEVGKNVIFGYFSQETNGLDYGYSCINNLAITGASTTDIYRQVTSLDLNYNDMQKLPSELSRGQLAKLSIAKLLLFKYHLLILDEPTNHLDIPTREKIESALQDYNGAMLIASHDTYFVNAINITKELILKGARKL